MTSSAPGKVTLSHGEVLIWATQPTRIDAGDQSVIVDTGSQSTSTLVSRVLAAIREHETAAGSTR